MSQLDQSVNDTSNLVQEVTGERFATWYERRQFAENIRQGTPYFNETATIQPATRHTPSQLLECHRKSFYRRLNAPREDQQPRGIFWVGDQFETELAMPFLRSLTSDEVFVRNSMWVDASVETGQGTLQFKGETDPVFVDADSSPLLLTEIKTTTGVADMDDARKKHQAQVHVYMQGLTEQHDCELTDAVILYADRDTLDVQTFHIPFDAEFWTSEVCEWAARNTGFRQSETLPPADPQSDWECNYCPYAARCGQTDHPATDIDHVGFLPLTEYPRQAVVDHVESYSQAKLTPTLAHQYPELREMYSVQSWVCEVCQSSFGVTTIEWDGRTESPPHCPECAGRGIAAPLSGRNTADHSETGER